MTDCNICKRLLDDPSEPDLTADCGGDCLSCMARVGDPDCARAVATIMAGDPCDDWSSVLNCLHLADDHSEDATGSEYVEDSIRE